MSQATIQINGKAHDMRTFDTTIHLGRLISDINSRLDGEREPGAMASLLNERLVLQRALNQLAAPMCDSPPAAETAQVAAKKKAAQSGPHQVTYPESNRIRDALAESDRIDALVENATDAMSHADLERLQMQQNAAWALVRALCLDVADITDLREPIAVDIGDAVIIVYEHQDFMNEMGRESCAGWIASRQINRPEPAPEWAKERDARTEANGNGKHEPTTSEPEDEDETESDDEFDDPCSNASIDAAIDAAIKSRELSEHAVGDGEAESSYESACWMRVRQLALVRSGLISRLRSMAEAAAQSEADDLLGPAGVMTGTQVVVVYPRSGDEWRPSQECAATIVIPLSHFAPQDEG